MATSSILIEGEQEHPSLEEVTGLASVAYNNWLHSMVKDASKLIFDFDFVLCQHPDLLKTLMALEGSLLDLSATDTCSSWVQWGWCILRTRYFYIFRHQGSYLILFPMFISGIIL